MLRIDIISVQPGMFSGFLTESIVARAVLPFCRGLPLTINTFIWTFLSFELEARSDELGDLAAGVVDDVDVHDA